MRGRSCRQILLALTRRTRPSPALWRSRRCRRRRWPGAGQQRCATGASPRGLRRFQWQDRVPNGFAEWHSSVPRSRKFHRSLPYPPTGHRGPPGATWSTRARRARRCTDRPVARPPIAIQDVHSGRIPSSLDRSAPRAMTQRRRLAMRSGSISASSGRLRAGLRSGWPHAPQLPWLQVVRQ